MNSDKPAYLPVAGERVVVVADVPDVFWRSLRGTSGTVLDRASSVPDRPLVVCLDGCTQRHIQNHDLFCRRAATFALHEIEVEQ
jgi:hypothetical protein